VGLNLALPIPLGKWLSHKGSLPGWFYAADKNTLYHSTTQGVTQHGILPRQSHAQAFHRHRETVSEHPPWASTQVATVRDHGDKVVLMGVGQFMPIHKPTLQQWFQHLEASTLGTTWNLEIHYRGSMEALQQAICQGKALMVADGSFKNKCGTCAWIIEGETAADCIEGAMQTPGQPGNHSSFQSEAAGIYGALLTIWYIFQEYPLTRQMILACDGRSVLDCLRSTKSIDPFAAHTDLLRACQHIMKCLLCSILYHHVKGHQDKGQPTVLSREAWLNIEADTVAKVSIHSKCPKDPTVPLPFEPWQLLINRKEIVKHHHQEIRWAMNRPAAQSYWSSKLPTTSHLLDNQAMERALRESTSTRCRWITKHITGHFAHGKNMQ